MKNKLIGVVCICVFILGCNITKTEEDNINTDGSQPDNNKSYSFPPYITPIESYFEFSIDEDPVISEESYKLEIHGLVEKPYSYTLSELRKMPMHERFQTTECIGNQPGLAQRARNPTLPGGSGPDPAEGDHGFQISLAQ